MIPLGEVDPKQSKTRPRTAYLRGLELPEECTKPFATGYRARLS